MAGGSVRVPMGWGRVGLWFELGSVGSAKSAEAGVDSGGSDTSEDVGGSMRCTVLHLNLYAGVGVL